MPDPEFLIVDDVDGPLPTEEDGKRLRKWYEELRPVVIELVPVDFTATVNGRR